MMNISWMGKGRLLVGAAVGAALCMAGAPGYGGEGAQGDLANGQRADSYDVVNLVPGTGYRSRINTRGQAAFEYVSLASRLRVGYFDGEAVSDISPPGADSAALGDMNEQGDVVEHTALPFGAGFRLRPFRWSRAAGWRLLPVVNADGDTFTTAINARGQVAGGSGATSASGSYRAVRWGAGNALQLLPTPADFGEATAYAINAYGTTAGAAVDSAGRAHAFIWDGASRPIDLGSFGASEAAALLNNDRGEVAGWLDLFGDGFQSFLWSPLSGVTRVGLHAIPGELNNVGELVGRVYTPDTGIDHAYVFSRARGLVDLHRAPFRSSDAYHVNDRGTVVGEMLSNTPGPFAQRAYRWARSGEAVDLTTRLRNAPDGLIVTQALRISPTGDIIANSNAGLVLLRRAGGTDAPVLGPIQIPEQLRPAQPFTLTLSFRDRNVRDTHSATVDWGDGNGPQAAGLSERNGRGELSAGHAYARDGDYNIVVRVTDSSGRVTVQARQLYLFPYCVPGITGAGSLAATAARATQPTLVFRLAAPLMPTCGKTHPFTFVLQGRVDFKADRLERVSRNGNAVHLEGSGKLDGQAGYRFIIDATDGQHGGALEADRMAVRIEQVDASGAALAAGARPAVLQYGLVAGQREGLLPPGALRLIE